MNSIVIVILSLMVLSSYCHETDPLQVPDVRTSCKVVDVTKLGLLPAYQTVYSGYLSVAKDSQSALAFVFYGSQLAKTKEELVNYPTLIWLNGGPGTSSHLGNFMEIGPIFIMADGTKVVNKYSWNTKYNIMFVDNPIAVGYSYAANKTEIPVNQDQVAAHFVYGLNEFFNKDAGCLRSQRIEGLRNSAWFMGGGSYAGKYIPAIAEQLTDSGHHSKNDDDDKDFTINLRGIVINDPYTELIATVRSVPSYAFSKFLLDEDQLIQADYMAFQAISYLKKGDAANAVTAYFSMIAFIQAANANINSYNIFLFGSYKYRDPAIQNYLNSTDIKQVFGFSDQIPYLIKNLEVKAGFTGDMINGDCVQRLETLLRRRVYVLVYSGDLDLSVPPTGTYEWVNNLKHCHSDEFRELNYRQWAVGDRVVGYKKSAGYLELRQVNNAGHFVPMDAPEATLDLISSFIESHKAVEIEKIME